MLPNRFLPLRCPIFFFKAWRSPAESMAPKRSDHGRSVHGEPKFTEESVYVHNSKPRVLKTLHICTRGLREVRVHKKFAAAS